MCATNSVDKRVNLEWPWKFREGFSPGLAIVLKKVLGPLGNRSREVRLRILAGRRAHPGVGRGVPKLRRRAYKFGIFECLPRVPIPGAGAQTRTYIKYPS